MERTRRSELRLQSRRPRRRWRAVAGVISLLLVLAAIGVVGAGWYLFVRPDHAGVVAGKQVEITIKPGVGTAGIAQTLSDAGVIANARRFRWEAKNSSADGKLKAGAYKLATGMDYDMVLAKLAKGPDIVYFDIPIPEGFTGKQIAARFAKRAGVSEDKLLALINKGAPQFADKHPYLANAHADSLEGYLFPATYRVKEGVTPEKIIEMMLSKFDEEIAGVDMTYAKSKNLTLNDVLTIASIIELEVRLDKEYSLVSSVIYNRLHLGMRLQLDSTVFFGLPEGTKVLRKQDLQNDHPYNTYSHNGLPPGPMGNSGIKAIQAAAHPKETKYLYYVLTGEDGSQTFATNYQDFLKAVAIYRQKFVNK